MATIPFVDTFDCQAPFPLDLRSVKSNIGQRDAIPNNARYDGMEVWVVNDQKKYRLEGGTANENWVEVTTDGDSSGTLQDVTFSSTAPTTQGNDGDIWFRPNDDTIELYYKVSGIWGMVGSWSNLDIAFENGLREDNGTVKLGLDLSTVGTTNEGILTEVTPLIFGDATDPSTVSGVIIQDGSTTIYGSDNIQLIANGSTIGLGGNGISIGRVDQTLSFSNLSNKIILEDELNYKGLEYINDYSANWTDHSLVTKKWVDDEVVHKSGDTMTGRLILMMGTSTQVPLLLPNGVLTTVPVVGAIEHSNRDLFFTNLWGQRRALETKKLLKNISGTTYNLNSEDTKFYLSFTNAAGCTVTVPPSIATNGDTIEGEQLTSGKVSFAAGGGVTLTKPNSKNLTTSEQGAVFKIYFKSGFIAHVYGDLELT